MTYRELAERILQMWTIEQMNKDVTIYVPEFDEYYPATITFTDDSCDVLDEGHPVIVLNEELLNEGE